MVDGFQNQPGGRKRLVLQLAALATIAIVCLWAISVVGTPETARNKKWDQARVEDLQRLNLAIGRFYEQNGKLPATLSDLDIEQDRRQDPQTGDPYGYMIVGPDQYQLSAFFAQAGKERSYLTFREEDWSHPAGLHHYSFTVLSRKDPLPYLD